MLFAGFKVLQEMEFLLLILNKDTANACLLILSFHFLFCDCFFRMFRLYSLIYGVVVVDEDVKVSIRVGIIDDNLLVTFIGCEVYRGY